MLYGVALRIDVRLMKSLQTPAEAHYDECCEGLEKNRVLGTDGWV